MLSERTCQKGIYGRREQTQARKEYKDLARACCRAVELKLVRNVKSKKEQNSLDSHDCLDSVVLERFTPHRVVASQFIMSALHQ